MIMILVNNVFIHPSMGWMRSMKAIRRLHLSMSYGIPRHGTIVSEIGVRHPYLYDYDCAMRLVSQMVNPQRKISCKCMITLTI